MRFKDISKRQVSETKTKNLEKRNRIKKSELNFIKREEAAFL